MKKTYISPSMQQVEIESNEILGGSVSIGIGKENVDPGTSWSNRHRNTNGWDNIWEK